jgi:hypothetical protein
MDGRVLPRVQLQREIIAPSRILLLGEGEARHCAVGAALVGGKGSEHGFLAMEIFMAIIQ